MRRVSLLLAVAASAAAFCTPSATVGALAMRPRVIDARSLRSPRTSTFRMESAGPEKPAHEHFPHGIGRLEQRTSAAKAQAGRRGTSSRRTFVTAFCAAVALGGNSHVAVAKDVINDCEKWAPGRKWLSGKSCQEKVSFVFGQLASKPCKQRAFTGINVLVARPSCERV
jgi:hypothetical protein